MDEALIGSWASDITDTVTKTNIGDVTITFTTDGRLIYDTRQAKKLQRMYMTYRVSGDTIVSDQQSKPQEQTTKYKLVGNDKLILEFEGIKTVFLRDKAE